MRREKAIHRIRPYCSLAEKTMAEPKKKAQQSSEMPASGKKEAETQQVVLTLSVPDGNVVKIEKLDKNGHRQPMPEEEFAALAGDDDAEDLGAVLEGAYTAGISDALNDELSEEEQESEEDEEELIRRFMLRRAAGRQLLRAGLRKFILRRRLRTAVIQRRTKSANNGRSTGVKQQ
jgi:hypothetical protein